MNEGSGASPSLNQPLVNFAFLSLAMGTANAIGMILLDDGWYIGVSGDFRFCVRL